MDDARIARGMKAQGVIMREHIAVGDMPLGWKVGFGAPPAMAKLGITAPLIGFLTRNALHESGALLSLAAWKKPVVEPEIAVYLGTDLPGGAPRAAVIEAIAALGPALELADLEFAPDDVEQILAGNIYQRGVILGKRETGRAGGVLDGLCGIVMRNGMECARTIDPQAATGELIQIVRHVADTVAACGEKLRAGQVIITGSIVPPLFVEPGEEVAFTLEPVGTVSVRFARD